LVRSFGPFSAVLASIGLMMLGSGLLGTLIAVSLALKGVSTWIIGLVMASYFSGFAAGAFSGHLVIARVGHIRAFTVFATLFSAAAFSHVFWANEPFWAILRAMQGYTVAGLFMCCESWLSEKSDNSTRGTVLSVYMVVIYLAQGFGQLLLQIGGNQSFLLFGAITVLASLGVIPVALTRIAQPETPSSERMPLRRLWKISPLGIIASLTSGATLGAIFALAPVYATRSGFETGTTALFMAAFLFGGLFLQYPVGMFSDRFDRRRLIAAALGGVFLASAIFSLPGLNDPNVLYGCALIFGAFSFVIYPLALSHANDFAESSQFVGVTAGLLLIYSLGAVWGPILAAVAMYAVTPAALFFFTGTAAFLAIIFTFWRMRQGTAPDPAEIGSYAPLPGTTPVALDLDPRARASRNHRSNRPPLTGPTNKSVMMFRPSGTIDTKRGGGTVLQPFYGDGFVAGCAITVITGFHALQGGADSGKFLDPSAVRLVFHRVLLDSVHAREPPHFHLIELDVCMRFRTMFYDLVQFLAPRDQALPESLDVDGRGFCHDFLPLISYCTPGRGVSPIRQWLPKRKTSNYAPITLFTNYSENPAQVKKVLL